MFWIGADELYLVIDHAKDGEVVACFTNEKAAVVRATVLGYHIHEEKPRYEVFRLEV